MKHLSLVFALSFALFHVLSARPGTTLENAFIRAYNERVQDGTWVSYFGNAGLLNQDFCPGNPSIWEWPTPVAGSDLYNSLQNGVFRCGYNGGQLIQSPTGEVILDTTGYQNDIPASGLVVDWFNQLANTISQHYNIPYTVTWNISYSNSNDIMSSVLNGELDGACGRYSVGGSYSTYGARGNVFSVMYCPTYLEAPLVTMLKTDSVSNWASFILKVNEGWKVCALGSVGGGTEQSCTSLLLQYTSGVQCYGNNNAFSELLNGNCDAVYGSAPPPAQSSSFSSFAAPVISSQGTLFRPTDENGDALATTIINVNIA